MSNKFDWHRITSDGNGNPRYVIHYLNLLTKAEQESYAPGKYEIALKRARAIGGKKYNNKKYGGGIAFQSYSLPETEEAIERVLKKDTKQNPPRRKRKTNMAKRRHRKNPSRKAKVAGLGVAGVAAAAVAVWYFFLRKKGGDLSNPLPITALRDPQRAPDSSGQSYPDRETTRANAVQAAKYLAPAIDDVKAQEIADAFMDSGLARSYMQRVLSVSEFTNLQPFRNVVTNLTK